MSRYLMGRVENTDGFDNNSVHAIGQVGLVVTVVPRVVAMLKTRIMVGRIVCIMRVARVLRRLCG